MQRRCQTFLLDPPALFAIGAIFAFVGRRSLVAGAPRIGGPSALAALFYAVLWWVAVQVSVIEAPDWMLTYIMPVEDLNMTVVNLVFLVGCVLSGIAGHTLTALPLQKGRTGLAFLNLLGGGAVWFGILVVFLDQYLHVGSYAVYMAGDAPLLPDSHIATAMNAQGVVLGLGFVIPAVIVYRRSRRLRAT